MKNIVLRLMATAAIFGSCTKYESDGTLGNSTPDGKVRLTLHTDMGSFARPVKTRSGVADENNMGSQVWVFILEKTESSSPNYTLRAIEQLDIKGNGDVDIIADQTTNPLTIVLLANAPNKYVDHNGTEQYFTLENLRHITSYSELKQVLNTPTLALPTMSVPYAQGGAIPMSGDIDLPAGISESSSLTVPLKRIVAKISVETEIPVGEFEILTTGVYNAPRNGWLLPTGSLWTAWRDNTANLTTYNHDAIDCTATQVGSKQTTASNPIYIYESRPQAHTAVIVQAIYGGNIYFYKLAMTADYSVGGSAAMPMNSYCRNFAYKYIITSVTGGGYHTLLEAYAGAPSNNIKSAIDVIDLSSHDIIDNGDYFLGVSNSEYIIYAIGARSNLIAVTMSTGGSADVSFGGTVTASEGITITKGATFLCPATENEVEISVADNFSTGTIVIRVGNLKKIIDVNREYTVPFDEQNIARFGTSDYVAGQIEDVSDNSGGDWIRLSPVAKEADLGKRTIVNNNGGIYIHMDVNRDKSNGVAARIATLYMSRKTNAGRVRVYLEQDYIDSRNI